MSLFDTNWMERSPVTGTVSAAEDRVYFTTTEGFGHFVLSVGLPDGDMSSAELVAAGLSLISSMALTGDEQYLILGDVDAKTLIRVTIGDPNSEQLMDVSDRQFYPGTAISLNVLHRKILIEEYVKSINLVQKRCHHRWNRPRVGTTSKSSLPCKSFMEIWKLSPHA